MTTMIDGHGRNVTIYKGKLTPELTHDESQAAILDMTPDLYVPDPPPEEE